MKGIYLTNPTPHLHASKQTYTVVYMIESKIYVARTQWEFRSVVQTFQKQNELRKETKTKANKKTNK